MKTGLRQRFDDLRRLGIRSIMITGDNALTAAAIAEEAGLDGFLAQATPEDKLALIRREQRGGNLVAMTGDGTNDTPALAQADVGVAMNTGTQAAREAGDMVDLDSDPTKLIEIVEIGKQLLITRGSLTTFSIANDVAKYFAIIPAMFLGVLPAARPINVMDLESPRSAILSAVIYNAIIIVLLVPRAPRREFLTLTATEILQRNLLIYGVGRLTISHPSSVSRLIDIVVAALKEDEVIRRQLLPAHAVALVLFTALTAVYVVGTTLFDNAVFHRPGRLLVRVKDAPGRLWITTYDRQDRKTKYFHPRPSADDYLSGSDYSYGSNFRADETEARRHVPARPERTAAPPSWTQRATTV